MNTANFFEEKLQIVLKNKQKNAKLLGCDYRFVVKGPTGGTWRLISKNTKTPYIIKGDGNANCTIMIDENDFKDIIEGRITAQVAFLQKKLIIIGNVKSVLRLGSLM